MLRRSQNFGYYLNIYIQATERSNHLRIVTIENSHFDIYYIHAMCTIPCSLLGFIDSELGVCEYL